MEKRMSDFTFTRGTFIKLRANSVIHLGRLERNIYEGDVVEFDGLSLKFNGQDIDMPELKAGIKRGWLSIVDGDATPEVKKPEVKKANEMPVQKVYDEERSVAEVTETKPAEETKKFPVVVRQDEDGIAVASIESKSGAEVSSASSASDGIAESQGAESVSTIKLKTASKQKTVISEGSQASAEISRLENMEASVTPRKVDEVDEVEDVIDPVPVEEAVQINDEVDIIEALATPEIEEAELVADEVEEDEPTSTPEEDAALETAQLLQAIEGDVDPSVGAVAIGKDDSKIKVLPGGIEWDTSKHWSKRAKIAMDLYGNDPDTLEAIKAVETKGVIAAIEKAVEEAQ
jgi:hypothetical protein